MCYPRKATEHYFHEEKFSVLIRVVLSFKSVDQTLMCDHSNESYRVIVSWGTVYNVVFKGGFNFNVCG